MEGGEAQTLTLRLPPDRAAAPAAASATGRQAQLSVGQGLRRQMVERGARVQVRGVGTVPLLLRLTPRCCSADQAQSALVWANCQSPEFRALVVDGERAFDAMMGDVLRGMGEDARKVGA